MRIANDRYAAWAFFFLVPTLATATSVADPVCPERSAYSLCGVNPEVHHPHEPGCHAGGSPPARLDDGIPGHRRDARLGFVYDIFSRFGDGKTFFLTG